MASPTDPVLSSSVVTNPRVPMAIRPYPSEWEAEVHIEPVGAIAIRPIRPQDEELYADFFAHVTPEDQRLRFFAAAPRLSHRYLATLTQIDYAREMAFVAVAKPTGVPAVKVEKITGIQRNIAYARSEKRGELHGSVLADNTTMLKMCRELGFAIEADPGDAGLRRVVLTLSGPEYTPRGER